MRFVIRYLILLYAMLVTGLATTAQVATGSYPYGTFNNMGFDTINVGNLDTFFTIPVLNKAGRGLPFYYNLSYDNSVWEPVSSSGVESWVPVQAFGWHADTEITTGYFSYFQATNTRIIPGDPDSECTFTLFSGFTYHDQFGVKHPFAGTTMDSTNTEYCGTSVPNLNTTATDGSGLVLAVTSFAVTSLTDTKGKRTQVPSSPTGSGVITDSNGNQITTDGEGHYTDTTGNVVQCPASFVPVELIQTGIKGAVYGTREEA
jgi:hypothetical protein